MLPVLLKAGEFRDQRGKISFFNDFNMTSIKRMYSIVHPDISMVRAWQGHVIEQKWFYIVSGSFEIVLIKPDNWDNPSKELEPKVFNIQHSDNNILYIPNGYINGFRATISNSEMIVFSDLTIEESKMDDYRYESERWYNWNRIIHS